MEESEAWVLWFASDVQGAAQSGLVRVFSPSDEDISVARKPHGGCFFAP